jgi:hypothetical protein
MNYKDVSDDRFNLTTDFSIKVPRDYSHHRWFRDFRNRFGMNGCESLRERVYKIEDGFNDVSLARSNFRFRAGTDCLVAIFEITRNISCLEALEFLQLLEADLVGGQGLTLMWPQAQFMIPDVRRVVSLDVSDNLPVVDIVRPWGGPEKVETYDTDSRIGMPYIFKYSGGDVGFHFDPFDDGLNPGHCLTCFKQRG